MQCIDADIAKDLRATNSRGGPTGISSAGINRTEKRVTEQRKKKKESLFRTLPLPDRNR